MPPTPSNPPASGSPDSNAGKLNFGELDLVSQIRRRAQKRSGAGVHLGIGDDCALLRLQPGEELAVTTDLSIAGRHFELDLHPPESIGHRALARGLSDLAAMGARPVAAFLSLGLPRSLSGEWLRRFLDGFLSLAARHKTSLAGGDLAESPLPLADIVLTGAVPRGKALLRSGARPGDLIYVTGNLGGSAAGIVKLRELARPGELPRAKHRSSATSSQVQLRIPASLLSANIRALAPHLYPEPRIAQGLFLLRRGLATAAIDLSDGLSTDLAHLCTESDVAAEIDASLLPIDSSANLTQALHGGEDYELLFAASPSARVPRRIAGVSVTRIGRALNPRKGRPRVTLLTVRGAEALKSRGWQHFS
jgi:thiamine-monophosphate kinase